MKPRVIEGVVQGHRDGHGFIIRDDGGPDLYIPPHVMHTVMPQDRVKAVVAGYDRKGRPEGQVIEIVERSPKLIIGRLLQENGVWVVAPEDNRYSQDILIPESGLAHAQSGQVVTVELTEQPTLHSQPVGRIVEVLGEIDDPGMEIEIAVRKYDVPHVFSPETLQEAQALPNDVRAVDKRSRVDLTDVPLVTIDGEDSRDFDDAVYCEPTRVGKGQGYRLLVAIADVGHYVKPGTALDDDAYERAKSVYFPRRVIPMLPEKISNGICSLNPDAERLCMVCDMLITAQGKTYSYQFYPAVMKCHARLTYTEVAAILTNTNGPEAKRRAEHVQDLLHLHALFQVLYQAREKRGAIDFDTVETRIVCDEVGRIERIEPYERNDAHRLIEEAMLVANVCAAEFVEHHKRKCLFRVHEGPTPEKREILQNYLRAIGVDVVLSEDPTTKEFQHIEEITKERPDASQIQMMLLRSMQQAIYTPINSGHFGLAYPAYTHFTSPIRRYPDLLLHRVIRGILNDKQYRLDDRSAVSNLSSPSKNKGALKEAQAARSRKTAMDEMQAWEVAGLHCSANERRADEASRDVMTWLKCVYMRDYLGEEFTGTVSAVTSFGLFIQLDSMYVEGLVHISELGSDYYRFDELRQELRGERSGLRYVLGTRVYVQVSRVDLDSRRIDFRLVSHRAGSSDDEAPMPQAGYKGSYPAPKGNGLPQGRAMRSGKGAGAKAAKAAPPKKAKAESGRSDKAGKTGRAGQSAKSAKMQKPGADLARGGTESAIDQLKVAVRRAARKATQNAKSRRPKAKR